jgi:hypothetical protein
MPRSSLEDAVVFIAGHVEYRGKDRAVNFCVNEIEERHRTGGVTLAQKERLIALLRGDARRFDDTVAP